MAVELKYQALLSCIVCVSCARNPGVYHRKLEGGRAAEYGGGVGAQEWRVISMSFEIDIYISGEERDRVCNQRVAPPAAKSSSPPVDCAICMVARQRGTDRRPSSSRASRGRVSMKI